MNWLFYIILFAVLISFVLYKFADVLNLKTLGGSLPVAYEHIYNKRRYAFFCAYEKAQIYLHWVDTSIKMLVFLVFWFMGGFNWLNNIITSLGFNMIVSGLIFGAVILWVNFLLEIPFNYYYTFGIEQKYGFNRTTKKTFVLDRIKVFVLVSGLGAILFGVLIWFFAKNYPLAWLWCWIVLCVLMFCIQWLMPNIIMPLFNKFSVLPEGPLRDMILTYAAKVVFSVKEVFVMDGSKRSSKLNAFVSGIGQNRRIVLYDMLMEQCDDKEVLAVLAHEIGHLKLRHLLSGLVVQFVYVGVLLFLFSLFVSRPELYAAFFMEAQPVYAGIIFFSMLYMPIDFFAGIILNYVSRRKEYAADRFAYETTDDAKSLTSVFEKLATLNLANLKPHWFYVMLNSTHPPLLMRIATIQKLSE